VNKLEHETSLLSGEHGPCGNFHLMMGGSLILRARVEPYWSHFTHTHPPAAFSLKTAVSRGRCGYCETATK